MNGTSFILKDFSTTALISYYKKKFAWNSKQQTNKEQNTVDEPSTEII